MSFFNNFFQGNDLSSLNSFWKVINTIEDLEKIVEESYQKKVVIFKHSTRCIISKTVLRNFEKDILQFENNKFSFYYLDLLNYRNISNRIASEFGVTHQSPQVLVIENSKVIHHASHDNIDLSLILSL